MPSKSRESLQQSLSRLHTQLAAAPSLDPKSRQLLREVLGDIERLLKESPDTGPAAVRADRNVPRLEALAIEFEAIHPGLAGSLRQLVDLLGRAGL